MERERITISIKKSVLDEIDKFIDGVNIRNRSHAIETLATSSLGITNSKNAVVLMGGKDAIKMIPAVKQFIKMIKANGFEEAYIALGFLGDKIKQKLNAEELNDIELTYLEEGEGTGGAVKELKKFFNQTFIVFNSVNQCDVDIKKLMDFHKKNNTIATIATDDLSEKSGIYIFEPEIFTQIPKGFSMLESDVFPKLLKNEQLSVYPLV